jgi:hypothetical protein
MKNKEESVSNKQVTDVKPICNTPYCMINDYRFCFNLN